MKLKSWFFNKIERASARLTKREKIKSRPIKKKMEKIKF